MKNLLLVLLCGFAMPALATLPDLEAVMKNMGFQFKQAVSATTAAEARPHLTELAVLTRQATQANFPEDKAAVYNEGLDKLMVEVLAAKQAADSDNLVQLKVHLQQIDELRKQYHKERRSSIWKLLFG